MAEVSALRTVVAVVSFLLLGAMMIFTATVAMLAARDGMDVAPAFLGLALTAAMMLGYLARGFR